MTSTSLLDHPQAIYLDVLGCLLRTVRPDDPDRIDAVEIAGPERKA